MQFCAYWGENSHKQIVNLTLEKSKLLHCYLLSIGNKSWKYESFGLIINPRN